MYLATSVSVDEYSSFQGPHFPLVCGSGVDMMAATFLFISIIVSGFNFLSKGPAVRDRESLL